MTRLSPSRIPGARKVGRDCNLWHIESDCTLCEGTGWVDDPRDAVFPAAVPSMICGAILQAGATLDDVVVIALEGRESEEEDWDVEDGAVLVFHNL